MRKLIWLIILILALAAAGLYYGGAEKIMVWYYTNKSGQDAAKVEEYLNKAEEYQQKIKEGIKQGTDNFDYYIEQARAYQYAGNVDKAIKVYKDYESKVTDEIFFLYHNNLAKLYESKKEYQQAINEYLLVVEKFNAQYPSVLADLTRNYLELGDKQNANKYYFQFKAAGYSDGVIEQRLEE